MSNLFEILDEFADQLPGFEMTSIVSLDTGMQLASVGSDDGREAEGADAFHSNLYRSVDAALPELGIEEVPESMVLSGEQTICVSERIGGTDYFWHVMTGTDTTLGFTHAIMRKYRDELRESVIELVG